MASAQQQTQQINIGDLDLQQLAEVRRQLDSELQHLSSSFQQLKQAQAKFKSCIENVNTVKPQNKGTTLLVPLTNSLYIPGRLNDAENVIVDVGTGYYVKKTRTQAAEYYKAKVDYIAKNLDTLGDTLQKKQDNLNTIINVMQAKIQAQSQPSKS
ncbi:Prefoldin alpha subunit [Coniophora puteana RWD-64-598 SS2]|uniref:Prefoldin alpha subunit n=1 Tax=Coniophora puteana (strain RWD-64-598) TaxID=741705 RepID=A0A5M3MFE7_CONPW|nr:Prefoldin alpha subunit [Coniophora puteana RWD-64-598 SS2]EIW77716.1 Prefoldin alpha subunit [Coniophora puteana RWD-64-598 SS2]